MTKPSTLTPAQAAAVLNVSPSTLRRWSADFAEHLSETARGAAGHHRSYSPSDMATLQRAGELLKTLAPSEVKTRLGLADETQQTAALATLPTLANELQQTRALILQLHAEIDDLKQAHADQAALLATVRSSFQQFAARQVKRNKHQQAELEEIRAQLADLQARRHWWQRLRGK